jgi:hypothetical protein
VGGKPEYYPEGVYNLRYGRGRWRAWEPVGNDPTYAVTAKLKREKALDAANFGVALKDEHVAGDWSVIDPRFVETVPAAVFLLLIDPLQSFAASSAVPWIK